MTTTASRRTSRAPSDVRVAGGWGFAEALLFFVIPDVFLTYAAIRSGWRRALKLCAVAVMAAALGGLVAYGWGVFDYESGTAVMENLPAIDSAMIADVHGQVAADGNIALLKGPRQGQPYKLFALAAGDLGTSPLSLVLITIPGRFVRFAIASMVAAGIGTLARKYVTERVAVMAWGMFWTAVYGWYWLG